MLHAFHRAVATPASDVTGAMAVTNSARHDFDVVRHVLGTEYASTSATQPKRFDARVTPVCMVLETTDGLVVTFKINNNAAYVYDGWLSIEHEDVLFNSLEVLGKSVTLLKGVMPAKPADYAHQAN